MPNTSRLLAQLATLTSIRDMELIEFSLLKTIDSIVQPRSLKLVRLDRQGLPASEIACDHESCSSSAENLTLSSELRDAARHLADADADAALYSVATADGVLVIYALTSVGMGGVYLQMTLAHPLSPADQHLMAGVLQIYRNFVNLLRHAQTDQLTGLANRKTFDDYVGKIHEIIPPEADAVDHERRASGKGSHWMVMVDVDHFKSINDRLGHLYGDDVLVLLSQLMQGQFREGDMIFRFGGEEFVLVLVAPDREACRQILERFRHAVETCRIPQIDRLTVSLGATRMDRHTFATAMVDRADQALYFSKSNGRNQVNFFEDLVARGDIVVAEIKTEDVVYF